ncbi:hypothetical protein HOO68_04755 [Candidatus Gracilibacteria bacterium]|nr:hypothetical protein [Candidatus Gracilibacteria bacterium]
MNNNIFPVLSPLSNTDGYILFGKYKMLQSIFLEKTDLRIEELQDVFIIFYEWSIKFNEIMEQIRDWGLKDDDALKMIHKFTPKFNNFLYEAYFTFLTLIKNLNGHITVEDLYKLVGNLRA